MNDSIHAGLRLPPRTLNHKACGLLLATLKPGFCSLVFCMRLALSTLKAAFCCWQPSTLKAAAGLLQTCLPSTRNPNPETRPLQEAGRPRPGLLRGAARRLRLRQAQVHPQRHPRGAPGRVPRRTSAARDGPARGAPSLGAFQARGVQLDPGGERPPGAGRAAGPAHCDLDAH